MGRSESDVCVWYDDDPTTSSHDPMGCLIEVI